MSLYAPPDGCPGGDICHGCEECLPPLDEKALGELKAALRRERMRRHVAFTKAEVKRAYDVALALMSKEPTTSEQRWRLIEFFFAADKAAPHHEAS